MKAQRQLLLFGCSLLFIVLFFVLPQNREWLTKKPLAYGNDFYQQKNHLDLEYRKIHRWETEYTYSKAIASLLRKKGASPDHVVLLPPTSYFKSYGLKYHVPEPAVFYYYTGIKTIWANSPKATEAKWYVSIRNGKLAVDSVSNPVALKDTVAAFKKFGVEL